MISETMGQSTLCKSILPNRLYPAIGSSNDTKLIKKQNADRENAMLNQTKIPQMRRPPATSQKGCHFRFKTEVSSGDP